MAKYYKVRVNFGGYIGCESVYHVFADDEDDAINEAREMAMEDCSFEIEDYDEDEED